jgi:hypothetical protein
MALEGSHPLLKVPNPPRDWVVRSDGLSVFERIDPLAELTGSNCNDDDGDQPGDRENRDADHQQNEQSLHEAPTFRD